MVVVVGFFCVFLKLSCEPNPCESKPTVTILNPFHAVRVHGAADHHRQLHRPGSGGAPAQRRQDSAGTAAGTCNVTCLCVCVCGGGSRERAGGGGCS